MRRYKISLVVLVLLAVSTLVSAHWVACPTAAAKIAHFVDQIALTMPPSIAEGDSGSLVVATATKSPVGLLMSEGMLLPDVPGAEPQEYIFANKIHNVLDALKGSWRIAGSASAAATSQELAADTPPHPGAWMRDGNPRFEEIKKIKGRFSEYLEDRLKPIKELVSLGTGADEQGEPYFVVGINYKREEVIEEKGLPKVWEGIPVKYDLCTEIRFK